jgi:hypothetical protein
VDSLAPVVDARRACLVPGAWVSPGARLTLFGEKSAKAAQLDTLSALQSVCDPAENCVDDVFDVALMEVGTAGPAQVQN